VIFIDIAGLNSSIRGFLLVSNSVLLYKKEPSVWIELLMSLLFFDYYAYAQFARICYRCFSVNADI